MSWRDAVLRGVEPLLVQARDAGVASALALGVVTTAGERATCVVGSTISHRLPLAAAAPRGRPVTADTPFDLASLTKPMATSTLLAGLVTAGGASLDQTLDALLPEAQGAALGRRSLRSLLGHRSGAIAWRDFYGDVMGDALSDDGGRGEARRVADPATTARATIAAVLTEPLRMTPDGLPQNDAVYSDLGFIALGRLLEVRLGAPLDALFERRVARPLGLCAGFRRLSAAPTDAADVVATEIWPRRCPEGRPLQGVVHDDNCAALDGVAGHAGLFASLNDVLTWARAWLVPAVGGVGGLGAALPAALVGRWVTSDGGASTTPESGEPSEAGESGEAGRATSTWRLGFDTPSAGVSSAGSLVSRRAFGHLGFTGTSVWFDPARGAAVVLLTNRVHPSREPHGPIKALRPLVHDAVWRALDARAVD